MNKKITIIGLGLIGGSLALDYRQLQKTQKNTLEIVGVDQAPLHQRLAQELGLVDSVSELIQAIMGAELIVLAIPVNSIAQLLPSILDQVDDNSTVVDMGSTKKSITEKVKNHPKRAQYVAAHPMAGTENSGPKAAHLGLFKGKTAVICDQELSGKTHLNRVEDLFRALEMPLIYMSATEHDLHTAYVSHLSHISSFVLANTVLAKEKNSKTVFDLAGGGFASTVRLAKSSPEMWGPIFTQNQSYIAEALASYISHLQDFQSALLKNDLITLNHLMNEANQIRRVLNRSPRKETS